MSDLEAKTLAWVEGHFSWEIAHKGWDSPRQLWEHIVTCDTCYIFGDCPYIEDNPEKPIQGPPVPMELRSSIERMFYAAFRPLIGQQLRDDLPVLKYTAGTIQVSQRMLDE